MMTCSTESRSPTEGSIYGYIYSEGVSSIEIWNVWLHEHLAEFLELLRAADLFCE